MKLLNPIDVAVLAWLKPELDSTLQSARSALERFVEEGQGITALRECSGYLHQVAGILNMVELTGAARLAEEMEYLSLALVDGAMPNTENTFSLLMQCIMQLPDYLEHLQNGNRDVPMVLLPLINELRSIRGEDILGEEAVYSAPTQQSLPEAVLSQICSQGDNSDFASLSLQFRAHLQGWLHNAADAAGKLAVVCGRISAQCREESSRKLFWVASALLTALADRSIERDDALKQSLVKVDQEVNFLNQRGIGEIRHLSPVRLTQELLYFVARDAGASPALKLVYEVFELARIVPDEEEIVHAKSSLLGRNNALFESVATVIKEDILRIKDTLDLSIRQNDTNPADIAELVGVLARIENTLGLIDAKEACEHIRGIRKTIQAYVDGSSQLTDSELMAIAKSLLSVEFMLDYHGSHAVGLQSRMDSDFMPSSQSHQLLDALIRESIVNFMQVQQAYIAFVESYWDHKQLLVIPALLKQVSGALAILEYTPVSAYIDAVNTYTRAELIDAKGIPNGDQMERLAEVLASLEYYLESVRDRRPNHDRILEIARKNLEALHYWPVPEKAMRAAERDMPSVSAPATIEHVIDIPATTTASLAPASANSVIVVEKTGEVVDGFDFEAKGINDEIREIFLEEFNEENANLAIFFKDWQANPDNIELIRPIRRVFHTLKGSGRLVGAKSLSEFSWKIESLLNRVLEGLRPGSNPVVAMINRAITTLPTFHKALTGERVSLDLTGLNEAAERLADGEEIYYCAQSAAEAIPAGPAEVMASDVQLPAVEVATVVAAEPVIDPVLLEILKPEVSGHLQTVNEWLHLAAFSDRADFEDALFRAIHTMNGAFAMSEVETMAGILAPAEGLIRRGIVHNIAANAETVACLAQVMDAVQATLDDLSQNKVPSRFVELESWVAAKRDELPELPSASPTPIALADMAAEQAAAEQAKVEAYGMSLEELERLTDPNYKPDEASETDVAASAIMQVTAELALPEFQDEPPAPMLSEAPIQILGDDGRGTGIERLNIHDLDEKLLDIFTEEAKDLLDQSDNLLVQMKQSTEGIEPLLGLQRNLHTLKGGARMAGLFSIGELSHSLESFIQASAEQAVVPGAAQLGIIEKTLDALHRMADQVDARVKPESPTALIQMLDACGEITATAAQPTAETKSVPAIKSLSGPIDLQDLDTDEGLRTPQDVIRIRADLLDQLVNFAGEVAIYRARLEQQLDQFKANLVELDQTTSRLREQLRRLDIETEAQIAARNIREADQDNTHFDPLELDRFTTQQQLSRSLAESSNDLINLQVTLDDLTRHHETLLLQQSRVSSELQEGLMRTRMVPFETLLPRLRRIMRQAAEDSGKQVELRVEGAQGEMDRSVLDRMTAPLEHLLRNAVAHGVESPDLRRSAGKSESGSVVINVAQEGTEVVFSVRDDGHGLDVAQIRSKAIQRGLIQAEDELSQDQVLALITHTGFSTVDTVTRLAGRGVGMDVVSTAIRNLNGSLDIQSTLGHGTEFIIRLPMNLAVTKAVFVKIGESRFAIPIASVDGVGRIGREELDEKMRLESPEFNYAGNRHKIYDLGNLLDLPPAKAADSMQIPMLLSKSGQDRIAICVDQVLGSQEIVVKPVGPQVTSVPGVYGASIMPDGGVIIILDLAPLVRHNAKRQIQQTPKAVEDTSRSMPLVMVVDDSITMRKVTSRILERNNFKVVVARDGLEAIEKMTEQVPDLVLLDIEMPRMDGYEVAQNMKSDARLEHVPIMMITSRTSEKHRQRAFDLGVERYLGKPYQEFELMRQLNEIFKS